MKAGSGRFPGPAVFAIGRGRRHDHDIAVCGEQQLLHGQSQQGAGEILVAAHAQHEQLGLLLLDHAQQQIGDVVIGGLLPERDAHARAAQLVAGDLELLIVGMAGVIGDALAQHVDHDQRPSALLRLLASCGQRLEAHLGGDESHDDGHLLSSGAAVRVAAARRASGLVRSYWHRGRVRGTEVGGLRRPGGRGRPGAGPRAAGSHP